MKAWREGECWLPGDGAPDGPEFTTKVVSRTTKDLVYTIHRDAVEGYILHQPACMSWKKRGPGLCSHVQEAIRRSEQPDAEFALFVHEWIVHNNLPWNVYAIPGVEAHFSLLAEAHNRWMEARGRIGDHVLIDVTRAEWAGKSREEQRAEVDDMFSQDYRVTS